MVFYRQFSSHYSFIPQISRREFLIRIFRGGSFRTAEQITGDRNHEGLLGIPSTYGSQPLKIRYYAIFINMKSRAGTPKTAKSPATKRNHTLRSLRESLGLTMKAVEVKSREIVRLRGQKKYLVSAARLSQIEGDGTAPGIFKLACLSEIYNRPITDLLRNYGISV